MSKFQQIVLSASKRARQMRAEIFRRKFKIDRGTTILDLGSETGENINLVLTGTPVSPENIFIADISDEAVETGRRKFGFRPVVLDKTDALPFEDRRFDIVYCSSVLEHVTLPKEKVWEIVSEREFWEAAWEKQKQFAAEIRRVGRKYFVQVPARSFPLESHTWLPFFSYLPRPLLVKAMRATNKFWIKQSLPDFNLLDGRQMSELFPEAEIIFERKFGFIKSIMAIKN